ncbi:MAG: hypothetical protein M5U12_13930 [Verrucomicrobia bacterium]|nr:hypothetical protein [Verrucomicrobiota bacterium]
MNLPFARSAALLLLAGLSLVAFGAANPVADVPTPRGTTRYVSKLGDDSDGSSWAKAFQTLQAALNAIPDDRGGHRIIVRPDTYLEANLFPAHRGRPAPTTS